MVLRNGKFGSFYACINYPQCHFTKQKVTDIGVPCPECGAKVIGKHSRGRVSFYSCERYPDCTFSSWDMPTTEKCPDCGKPLFFRKSRNSIICRDKKCGYKREAAPAEKPENGEEK